MESVIGKVTHYFPRAGVAVVILDDCLAAGETIRIRGPHDDFCQTVNSMEIDHQRITEAERGQDIGIKVIQRVHEGDLVYRET
jgi:putative protease